MFDLLLLFSREYVFITILTLLYISGYKAQASRVIFVLLFSMVFNGYLKTYFAVPLPAELGDGYAFPSGHMQMAFGFWGWMMVEFRHRMIQALCIFALAAVAIGLVGHGYHDWLDVWAAIGFGMITLGLYAWVTLKLVTDHKKLPLIGLGMMLLSCMAIFFNAEDVKIQELVLGSYVGFVLGIYLTQKQELWYLERTRIQKILSSVVSFCGIGGIFFLAYQNYFDLAAPLKYFLQYFMITLWISFLTEFFTIKRH